MPEVLATCNSNIYITLGQIVASSSRPKEYNFLDVTFSGKRCDLLVHLVERPHLQPLQLNVEVDLGDGG